MNRYVLTAQAQEDPKQIRDNVLQEGGFRIARYVVASMVNGFRAIARTPGQGHRREDLTPLGASFLVSVFVPPQLEMEKAFAR